MSLESQIQQVRQRIEAAATRAGRRVDEILLLGISKYHSPEVIRSAFAVGVHAFGENYVQEAMKKRAVLDDLAIDWHFTGHLQSNKAKAVVGEFSLIHSLDRYSLAKEISKRARANEVVQRVLLEVNLAGEESKAGISPKAAPELLEKVLALPNIQLDGVMCMPPLSEDENQTRDYFRKAKELRDQWKSVVLGDSSSHPFCELSMGTSYDFELAIEEGATIVRLGTVLLGAREY